MHPVAEDLALDKIDASLLAGLVEFSHRGSCLEFEHSMNLAMEVLRVLRRDDDDYMVWGVAALSHTPRLLSVLEISGIIDQMVWWPPDVHPSADPHPAGSGVASTVGPLLHLPDPLGDLPAATPASKVAATSEGHHVNVNLE